MGTFTPNTWVCPAEGGDTIIHYRNEGGDVKMWNFTVQPSGAFTAEEVAGNIDYVDVLITVPANPDPTVKELSLVITGVDYEGNILDTATFNFTLDTKEVPIKDIQYIYNPIIYKTETEEEYLEYSIKKDENVIFYGKSYKRPGDTFIEFRLNDVFENYLSNSITIKDDSTLNLLNGYVLKANLSIGDGNVDYTVINNWAYKEIPGTENFTKSTFTSDPISTDIDPRQYFLSSIITYKTDKNPVIYKFDNTQYSPIASGEGINGYYFMKRVGDINKITATIGDNTMTYNVVNCYNYVLYYKNAFGGWDSLLLKANVKQSDELSYETYKKYPNSFTDFSRVTYMTTITPTWTLYTGILTDKQAEKMYHLITSNEVYLHNLIKDEITPVNIDNNVFEHKSYKNNGNRMFQYEINCTASQDKYRK